MLTPLALLPVLAVTVTGVTTQTQENGITIDVATSEPVAPTRVRPMAGHRLLYLFVDDATPEQEVFRSGGRTITARARTRYTKLEIPVNAGQRCYEPAEVRATPSGVSVQFSCSKSSAVGTEAAQQETPDPVAAQEPQAPKSKRSQELLKAALALPADMAFAKTEDEEEPAAPPEVAEPKPLPSNRAAAPKPKTPVVAAAPVVAPAPEPVAEAPAPAPKSAPVAQAKPVPAPVALPAVVQTAPAPAPQAPVLAGTTGGNAWFVLGVLLLVGAVGGMLAFTRRRARRVGLIHILETAAIGPKRSLLVAKINGRTMVLGASEAGIALLESIEGKEAAPVAQVMGEPPPVREKIDEPLAQPQEAAGEPEGEVGVLRRLFRRKPKLVNAQDEAAFRELLAESYEDQELRERLSQGLVAKVS